MKRILLLLLLVTVLTIAYFTKPDNKTCIEAAVKAVWGDKMPVKTKTPEYYEQFMDIMSENVTVNDWVFLKRIHYRIDDKRQGTVGFGAFRRVFITY